MHAVLARESPEIVAEFARVRLEEGAWAGHEAMRTELTDIRETSTQTLRRIDHVLGGEAVEVARQLAAHAPPDIVHASTAAFLRLRDRFQFESRGVTAIGPDVQMRTFLLRP